MKIKIVLVSLVLSLIFSVFYIWLFFIGNTTNVIYVIQVGIYSNESNAISMVENINNLDFDGNLFCKDGQYYVLAGIVLNRNDADEISLRVSNKGINCYVREFFVGTESIEGVKEGVYIEVLEELSNWF